MDQAVCRKSCFLNAKTALFQQSFLRDQQKTCCGKASVSRSDAKRQREPGTAHGWSSTGTHIPGRAAGWDNGTLERVNRHPTTKIGASPHLQAEDSSSGVPLSAGRVRSREGSHHGPAPGAAGPGRQRAQWQQGCQSCTEALSSLYYMSLFPAIRGAVTKHLE